jgi:hypothetical protein
VGFLSGSTCAPESPETDKLANGDLKERLKAEISSRQIVEDCALLQFISWPPVTLNEMH